MQSLGVPAANLGGSCEADGPNPTEAATSNHMTTGLGRNSYYSTTWGNLKKRYPDTFLGAIYKDLPSGPWNSNERPIHEGFTKFERRLQTFTYGWQGKPGVSTRKLAESGFFYRKAPDTCACARCGLELSSWDADDDVDAIHCIWAKSKLGKQCEYAVMNAFNHNQSWS